MPAVSSMGGTCFWPEGPAGFARVASGFHALQRPAFFSVILELLAIVLLSVEATARVSLLNVTLFAAGNG